MTNHWDRHGYPPPPGDAPHHGAHHGGAEFEQQIDGMLNEVLGGGDAAGFVRRLVGGQDKQFWMGALVGAGAVFLLTNPAVKQAIAELFRSAGKPAEPAPQEPEPQTTRPAAAKPKKTAARKTAAKPRATRSAKPKAAESVE